MREERSGLRHQDPAALTAPEFLQRQTHASLPKYRWRAGCYRPVTSGHLGVRDGGCLFSQPSILARATAIASSRDPSKVAAVGLVLLRNHHGPLIEAGARKNEKINTLVVHGREITTFTNSLEDIVSKRKNYPYRSDPARRMGLKMKKPSRVRFRANRTLSRHRRMTESDPEETSAKLKSRSARARR